jgi:hypothetical protein
MTLRAWFDPKWTSDLRESLVDRQLLGSWSFRRVDNIPGKKLSVLGEDLHTADGSKLRVTATCDQTFSESQTTLAVLSGSDTLYVTTARGSAGFSATVPTGNGGFLTVQIDSMAQVQATHAA